MADKSTITRCLGAVERIPVQGRVWRVQAETKAGRLLNCRNVAHAPAAKVRQISAITGDLEDGYFRISVTGHFGRRGRSVGLLVEGEAPASVVHDIKKVIDRHCPAPSPRRAGGLRRLWQWFCGHVWQGVVAGLVVMVIGALLTFVGSLIR